MKIISWNLRNLSKPKFYTERSYKKWAAKDEDERWVQRIKRIVPKGGNGEGFLSKEWVKQNMDKMKRNSEDNKFDAKFEEYDIGNDILDYITQVVLGDNIGNYGEYISELPADIFVIIELKTSGSKKRAGSMVYGNCEPTIKQILKALNEKSPIGYNYEIAPMRITGRFETVGIIYNNMVFNCPPEAPLIPTLPETKVIKYYDESGGTFSGNSVKLPFMATLIKSDDNSVFKIVGIHAPPDREQAIQYVSDLAKVAELQPDPTSTVVTHYFIMGDFNCCPYDELEKENGGKIEIINGFMDLYANGNGYGVVAEGRTLSSLRDKIHNYSLDENKYANTPDDEKFRYEYVWNAQGRYLANAYDNLLYRFSAARQPVRFEGVVMDLIGNAQFEYTEDDQAPLKLAFDNFKKITNHLPVVFEFNF